MRPFAIGVAVAALGAALVPVSHAQTIPSACAGGIRPAKVFDVRNPAAVRSPFDNRAGLSFVVSPAVTGDLPDVEYPVASGDVTVDGEALTPSTRPGEGFVRRAGTTVIWRAMRALDGSLYLEVFATDRGFLPRQMVVRSIVGCPGAGPATTFTVDLGALAPTPPPSGSGPVQVCQGITAEAPASAAGIGRFSLQMADADEAQLTAADPACGFLLDGDIIATYGDALRLIDRWLERLDTLRSTVLSMKDDGGRIEPIVDKALQDYFPLRAAFARKPATQAMDPEEENALLEWFAGPAGTIAGAYQAFKFLESEEGRILSLRLRRDADAFKSRQSTALVEADRAFRERQRRAFDEWKRDPTALARLAEVTSTVTGAHDEIDGYFKQYDQARDIAERLGLPLHRVEDKLDYVDRLRKQYARLGPLSELLGKIEKLNKRVDQAYAVTDFFSAGTSDFDDIGKGVTALKLSVDGALKAAERIPYAQFLLAPLVLANSAADGVAALAKLRHDQIVNGLNRKDFEAGDWRGPLDWSHEPGGSTTGLALAEYLRSVRLGKSRPALPSAAVAKFFIDHRGRFESGAPWPRSWHSGLFTKTLDPVEFPDWIFRNRLDVWGMLYGSRRVPPAIR